MQIDVGFADVISPGSIPLQYPTLLQMPAPQLRGYSRESVIAEKLQAMVYLGMINSRMKDFYDLWILSSQFDFEGILLQDAIRQTFQRRETGIPEGEIIAFSEDFASEKQTQWQAFLRRNRLEGIENDFGKIVQHLKAFLTPLLSMTVQDDLFPLYWPPGGTWKGT
jgi:hypothetical protein